MTNTMDTMQQPDIEMSDDFDMLDLDTSFDPMAEEELQEEPPIPPEEFIAHVTGSMNLVPDLGDAQLAKIADQVLHDHDLDRDSMEDWFTRMERGINLAKLVKEDKTYPFPKAANVKYPLVTSAALQFNARAYPAIVPADMVVKTQTWGEDKNGAKAARGDRIANHMSYQLTNEIEEWEEDTDSLLVQLPIVGTMVRKVWHDPVDGRVRTRLLEAGSFIVNHKVRNIADAPRCGEEIPLYPSEITARMKSGLFVEFDYTPEAEDDQGPQMFIEQHCVLDLDEDGTLEPYIVTVHKDTQTVVRIVADFEPEDVNYERTTQMAPVETMQQDPFSLGPVPVMTEQPQEVVTGILSIKRGSYFVVYKFMPALDGGFHGTGLGLLLGDISDTINTIINMMLDAGHMASLGGGFIGSEFRIKGGRTRFEPGEWKLAEVKGADLRSSLVPMTFPGPDAVLFQLLGLLIDAGKEISSTKDIMTGDNGGRVQTATTTLALIEQGMMVFSAAYKRIFRSLKREFKLIAKINARTVTPEAYNEFHDGVGPDGQPVQFDPRADYNTADMAIVPVADPRSVTKMQELAKAELISNMAQNGLVNPAVAGQRILEAAEIPDTEELAPQQDPMAQEMAQFTAQMTMQMAKTELSLKMVEVDTALVKIEREKAEIIKTMTEADAKQAGLRLDAIRMILEENRNALERTITGGVGGMAGRPGNTGGQVGAGPGAGSPAGSGLAGILERPAMAGSGPIGPAPYGGLA